MRSIDDIHGDYQDVVTLDGTYEELEAATINLVHDIPDLLAKIQRQERLIRELVQEVDEMAAQIRRVNRAILAEMEDTNEKN